MLYYQCKTLVKTFLLLYPITRHVASFMKVGGGGVNLIQNHLLRIKWGGGGWGSPLPPPMLRACIV